MNVSSQDANLSTGLSKKPIRFCALMIAMVLPGYAWGYTCSTKEGATVDIPIPNKIVVGRDYDIGGPLSGWWGADGGTSYYVCTLSAGENVYMGYKAPDLIDSGITYDGYTVWKTSLDGVGIAIRTKSYSAWQQGSGGSWLGPSDVLPSTSETSSGNYRGWSAGATGHSFAFGGSTEVIMVKTGPMSAGKIPAKIYHSMYVGGTGEPWLGNGTYDRKYRVPEFTVTTLSCRTPDVSVELGDHSSLELPAVGSRTAPVKFKLQITDCAAGLNVVNYGFNVSSGTEYTAAEGLVGLTRTSTAKGIKVKLMNAAGTAAVKFNEWIKLDDYKSSTGGSYQVDLSAAYERTGDITSGTANAEIIVAMNYN